jgi:hypothetical protein
LGSLRWLYSLHHAPIAATVATAGTVTAARRAAALAAAALRRVCTARLPRAVRGQLGSRHRPLLHLWRRLRYLHTRRRQWPVLRLPKRLLPLATTSAPSISAALRPSLAATAITIAAAVFRLPQRLSRLRDCLLVDPWSPIRWLLCVPTAQTMSTFEHCMPLEGMQCH